MNALLGHLDLGAIVYGAIIFLGLYSLWYKFTHGMWIRLIIELAVFTLVFKLHGGSMQGGFAATIAALLSGIFMRPKRR